MISAAISRTRGVALDVEVILGGVREPDLRDRLELPSPPKPFRLKRRLVTLRHSSTPGSVSVRGPIRFMYPGVVPSCDASTASLTSPSASGSGRARVV